MKINAKQRNLIPFIEIHENLMKTNENQWKSIEIYVNQRNSLKTMRINEIQ